MLAFLLAAKFKRPLPIISGILVATLLNHGLAGALGAWITTLLSPVQLSWIVGLTFLGMAAWTLIPDKIEEEEAKLARFGVFVATLLTFFLAEMGDKTQVATVALAIQYEPLWAVVLGTTAGMLLANVPAVYLGDRLAGRIPLRAVHLGAAALFALLGLLAIAQALRLS